MLTMTFGRGVNGVTHCALIRCMWDDRRRPPKLLARTRAFAIAAVRFYSSLPRDTAAQVLGKQLLRSATSVGAQYREAQRAKSVADFISKSEGALQELDESAYWLELIDGAGINSSVTVRNLRSEAEELPCIFVAITRNAKANRSAQQRTTRERHYT